MAKSNEIVFPKFHAAQRQIYSTIRANRRTVMRCGRRLGKALAIDTPIPTPSGWTTMGELKEGDVVFDEAGNQCRVTFSTEVQFGRPCNRVVFNDGSVIVADDDHLWLTWDRCARKNAKRNARKVHKMENPKKPYNQAPKIRTTAEIAETISSGSRGDTNHSVENCKPIACDHADLPIPPYVFGAWIGDGLSDGARFVCNDDQIIDEIRREGQNIYKLDQPFMWSMAEPGDGKGKGLHSRTLLGKLRKLGVLKNKHIPNAYLRASENQRLALLQGLMDTDGTAAKEGNCEFTSVKEVIALGFLELALSLGIRATMHEGRAKIDGRDCGPKWRITFSTDLPAFRLKRKLDRQNSRKGSDRNINHRFIVSVERCPSVPVKCIQVDSPSHLYLAGRSFIPTHNTTALEILAGDEAIKGKRVGWFAPSYKLNTPTFSRILNMIRPVVSDKNKTEMIINTDQGGCVEFWTLGDEDAGRSRFYDWVILDEASLVKKGLKQIWEQAISPTLLDRGGSAVMAGTPKGIDPENFFYEACQSADMADKGQSVQVWKEIHMPTWENPMLNAEDVARLQFENPPLVYQQEYCADFVDWSGAAFFAKDRCLIDGEPVDYPARCDSVFAVIDSATKTGKEHDGTAVTFCAIDKTGQRMGLHPLTLLDWDIVQIEGALLETWLPSVFERLEELARMCGARRGSLGVWIEDKASGMILLQQARNRGWNAWPIESKLTSVGKDERAISVSGYVYQRLFKISRYAWEKTVTFKLQTANHFERQFFGYRVGQKDAADDLTDCATYSLAIALGNAEGY